MIREFLRAIRDVLSVLMFIVYALAAAFVAGCIVGAFFYGVFTVAGLAPSH